MDHTHHHHQETSLRKVAFSATVHCLTGCAVGEVLGMVIGNVFNIHNLASVVLSIILAFVFGYSFSIIPLLRHGLSLMKALSLALAADTVSITVMELVDNGIMLVIPGAINAGLSTIYFWGSLAVSLFVAFWSAYPVNIYLISKGKGHAVVHEYH